jgi:hypothetical protein
VREPVGHPEPQQAVMWAGPGGCDLGQEAPILGRQVRADACLPGDELLLRQRRVQPEAVTGGAEHRGRTRSTRQSLDSFPYARPDPVHSCKPRVSKRDTSSSPCRHESAAN